MMSGVFSTVRIARDALFSRLAKAVAVRATSLVAGSFTVSKKRSMLKFAMVSSLGAATGTGVALTLPVAAPESGSGRMVYERDAKSSGPVRLVTVAPLVTLIAVEPVS